MSGGLFIGLCFILSAAMVGCDASKAGKNGTPKASSTDDTLLVDFPIAFVERPLPVDDQGKPEMRRLLDPSRFLPGARLIIKDRASAAAGERVLNDLFPPPAANALPLYDVKDLAVSNDGKKLLFALREPQIPNTQPEQQPTWDIWEYDIAKKSLKPLIDDPLFAAEGDDVAPQYLPDGRVIFSSSRVKGTRTMLVDEGKPQYTGVDDKRALKVFNLHIIDPSLGHTSIEQITFNGSQDLDPTVTPEGDIVFVRRDAIANLNSTSLYRVKPDGTQLEPYYGYHSQTTGTQNSAAILAKPQMLKQGQLVALLMPAQTLSFGGDLTLVDGEQFFDMDTANQNNLGSTAKGQESLSLNAVDTRGVLPSKGGYFSSVFSLGDGDQRLLVSWSQCRLIDPVKLTFVPCSQSLLDTLPPTKAAPLLYGLWIFNPKTRTQLPVKIPSEGKMFVDAVALAERTLPTAWRPLTPNLTWSNFTELGQVGVLHIRSVFDLGVAVAPPITTQADPVRTPIQNKSSRFIRILKRVPVPSRRELDFNVAAFGRSQAQGFRDLIGYVPIEPDGSAKFFVPADLAFTLEVVDAKGQRVGNRHQNWLQLKPKEERECTGCHSPNTPLPHGRADAEPPSQNAGALGSVAFLNTALHSLQTPANSLPIARESMAEYYARVFGPRVPSVDLIFSDEWTDPAKATPAPVVSQRYIDIQTQLQNHPKDPKCLPLDPAPKPWKSPLKNGGQGWTQLTRVTINYLDHIQPIWEADRRTCDNTGLVTQNDTCTACHSRQDTLGDPKLPDGQLELTSDISADQNQYVTSYAELFFDDNQQELLNGALLDVIIERETGEFETDAEGNIVLGTNGQPIPIIERLPVPISPPLSTAGARQSLTRFFNKFGSGQSHAGRLSEAELKLLSEWLDLGAQYYNNPFDAPLTDH